MPLSSQGQTSAKCRVTPVYISASTNRYSRAADVLSSSLVVFGAGSLLSLWPMLDVDGRGVVEALPGHEGVVTCVLSTAEKTALISADDKGFVRYWRLVSGQWACCGDFRAHNHAISALAVHDEYIVTGSSDAFAIIWRRKPDLRKEVVFVEVQRLDLKGRFPLDIQVVSLPHTTSRIMAIASTDRSVGIWTMSEGKFAHSTSLPGHEDWVKSLAFQHNVAGPDILTLASGSQDGTIRLWNIERHIKENPVPGTEILSDELLDSFEAALGDTTDGEEGGRQISNKRHIITIRTGDASVTQYSITFDALLVGHEAGVTSVSWRPTSNKQLHFPVLLSTSTDSSVILWSQISVASSSGLGDASLWINQYRFGDAGGQRLGGFVGGLWSPNGEDALSWGWNGGWRRWHCQSQEGGTELWTETNAITGHRGPVRGVDWSPGGEYLISVGPDQTSRIHSVVKSSASAEQAVWHEIGRPQVHGYDLNYAVFLSPTCFVSVADEKVARVFDAPRRFVVLAKSLNMLKNIDEHDLPTGASVPPLGLSNKALSSDAADSSTAAITSQQFSRRPFEAELALSTLWPEVEKIFGHGYELHTAAVSHNRRYVATACKATSIEHAGIRVYDTRTWQLHGQPLGGHALTVTRITFSPDDRHILSVSRDRTWRLFEVAEDGYKQLSVDKSHARIIWDCAWTHEGDLFATASRDKTVKFWLLDDSKRGKARAISIVKVKEAATAIAFAPAHGSTRRVAVGLETGEILIYAGTKEKPSEWNVEVALDQRITHIAQINRLCWRPIGVDQQSNQLASCSDDGTLRMYDMRTTE